MKWNVVLVPFPFDDLSSSKVRPAICLTDEIMPYGHVVLAFVTSKISSIPSETDLIIDIDDPGFAQTGLKVASTVRLHRLATISRSTIRKKLGQLSASHKVAITERLLKLFDIDA
jgi:mRNA interferase MazF